MAVTAPQAAIPPATNDLVPEIFISFYPTIWSLKAHPTVVDIVQGARRRLEKPISDACGHSIAVDSQGSSEIRVILDIRTM